MEHMRHNYMKNIRRVPKEGKGCIVLDAHVNS